MISPRTMQAYLADQGFYTGPIDGALGTRSLTALVNALAEHNVDTKGWEPGRLLIGLSQLIMTDGGVMGVGAIDGYVGPMYQHALENWQDLQRIDAVWAPTHNPSKRWPLQKDVEDVFGKPGTNLVMVTLPYEMTVAWNGDPVRRVQCNRFVADSFQLVLENVAKAYSTLQRRSLGLATYSGGFNIRPMKTSTKLSMHAYGIAFDFDDQRNALRMTHAQARFAGPEYDAWWQCWEKEGWISLGRERDFDWMHVQAARLS